MGIIYTLHFFPIHGLMRKKGPFWALTTYKWAYAIPFSFKLCETHNLQKISFKLNSTEIRTVLVFLQQKMAAILKSRISQIPQGWQLHIQLDIIVGMSYNNNYMQQNYCSQRKIGSMENQCLAAGLWRQNALLSFPPLPVRTSLGNN